MNKTETKKAIVRSVSRNQMRISRRLDEFFQQEARELQRKTSDAKLIKTS